MKKTAFPFIMAFFLLTLFLHPVRSSGQTQNAYQFIEPNVSVSYDSNVYKIGSRYSNSTYETESYDFKKVNEKKYTVRVHVSARPSSLKPSKETMDSSVQKMLRQLKASQDKNVKIDTTDTKTINDISCMAMVISDKNSTRISTIINGLKMFDGGYCEISYIASGSKDLKKEYRSFDSLTSGFKFYSKQEINKEEVQIKNKYTVRVDTSSIITEDPRQITYSGVVQLKQRAEHIVVEARLNNRIGQEIFLADENGHVLIVSADPQKGRVIKRGELIVLNAFGKKVKLPFTFSYISKGIKSIKRGAVH